MLENVVILNETNFCYTPATRGDCWWVGWEQVRLQKWNKLFFLKKKIKLSNFLERGQKIC